MLESCEKCGEPVDSSCAIECEICGAVVCEWCAVGDLCRECQEHRDEQDFVEEVS